MTGLVKAESIVVREEPTLALPDIFRLAGELQKAQGFLPKHLQNPGQIAAVVLAGQELGIPPMASIRGIKLVMGNVTLDASLQLAVMARGGVRFKWLEQTDKVARLWLQRPGFEPHEQTFTIEDAQRAGVLSNDTWKKYPAAMLRARCVSAAGKAYAPDMLSGVYLAEELPSEEVEAPSRAKPRRTLDDVAGVSREQGAIDAGMSDHAIDSARHEDEANERAQSRVEHDAETGETAPYTVEHHLGQLPQVGVEALKPWLETLRELSPTKAQWEHAKAAFQGRCRELNVDPKQYAKKQEG